VRFEVNSPDDIVIPLNTEGKFRVKKLKVIAEHTREDVEKMLLGYSNPRR